MKHFGVECDECSVGAFVAISEEWSDGEPTQIIFYLLQSEFDDERKEAEEVIDFQAAHTGHNTRLVIVDFDEGG